MRVIVKVSGFSGSRTADGLRWLITQELLSVQGFRILEDEILLQLPLTQDLPRTSVIEISGTPNVEWPTSNGTDAHPVLKVVSKAVQFFLWELPVVCILQRPNGPLALELPPHEHGIGIYPISTDPCGNFECRRVTFECFGKRLCRYCGKYH